MYHYTLVKQQSLDNGMSIIAEIMSLIYDGFTWNYNENFSSFIQLDMQQTFSIVFSTSTFQVRNVERRMAFYGKPMAVYQRQSVHLTLTMAWMNEKEAPVAPH